MKIPSPIRSRSSRFLPGLVLGAVLAGGCAGPAHLPIVGEPEGHPGFPSETRLGAVWLEARFVENHARILGQDLSEELGVIPIALRIGLRSEDGGFASLDEESLDPVLYLQDGTTLPWVPLEELKERDDRLGNNALETSLVPNWADSRAGFLFFSAREAGVRVQDRHALVTGENLNRELDLVGSVVGFTLTTERGPLRVHLGLGLDRWEVDR